MSQYWAEPGVQKWEEAVPCHLLSAILVMVAIAIRSLFVPAIGTAAVILANSQIFKHSLPIQH